MVGLINMNGRMYDPALGRMLSADNYVQQPNNTQSYNRYSYCINNPTKYTDPSGDIFFVMPTIGYSEAGGLDLGVTVGVGVPGLSAQVSIGYQTKSGNAYASVGGTVGIATASVTYGTKSGLSAGIGMGFGSAYGLSSNMTSMGMTYSNGTASYSVFGLSEDGNGGYGFDPSVGFGYGFQTQTEVSYKMFSRLEYPAYACETCPAFEASSPDIVITSRRIEKSSFVHGDFGTSIMASTLAMTAATAEIPPAALLVLAVGSSYALYNYYAGKGNANYQGPLTYTYEHSSQNPIHRNPLGGGDHNNPLPGTPSFGSGGTGLIINIAIAYTLINSEYRGQMDVNRPLIPKDNTNYVPQSKPAYIKQR